MASRSNAMPSVSFLPWIGKRYECSGLYGIKILLLGESHYGDITISDSRWVTNNVIRTMAIDSRFAFFTKTARLLLLNKEHSLSISERSAFWNRVAFYNYCQEIVGEKSRVRPSSKIWAISKPPFLEVLEHLTPDLVVVLGKKLGQKIPDISSMYHMCQVNHPSSNFSYDRWIPVMKSQLDKAGAQLDSSNGGFE